jgi:Na+/H+-dicarboxylate symporter
LALLEGLFPSNFVEAVSSDNLLGVITASIAIGAAASVVARKRKQGVFGEQEDAADTAGTPDADRLHRAGSTSTTGSELAAAGSGGEAGRKAGVVASRIAGASATSYTFVEKLQAAEEKESGAESLGRRTGSIIIWFAEEVQASVIVVVEVVIDAAPIAVASLLAATFAAVTDPGRVFAEAGLLIGIHALAILLHVGIILPLFHTLATGACCCTAAGRRMGVFAPYLFMSRHCTDAYLTALATSSSAATLPVTMKCVTNGGVPSDLARFTTSLGATLNLDGTAIGYPIVALWMAQTSGIPITAAEQAIVAVMGTLASVGAAPIPQAGTVLLISIWAAAFPDNPLPAAFGIFLSVDALMDR